MHQRILAILPAYNEAPAIAKVVSELKSLSRAATNDNANLSKPLFDDIIVCDNGSDDNTGAIAREAGATVVNEVRRGYGFACLRAIDSIRTEHAEKPDIVVFVDADHSVKVSEVHTLIAAINQGNDLVVGSRNNALLEDGALTPPQKFGNALASFLIRLIWDTPVTDLGPFRAIRWQSLVMLNMQDERFGWTVEMQVKAIQAQIRYCEVPVSTRKRIGVSKISGTVRGTIGAGVGILSKIALLRWHQKDFRSSMLINQQLSSNH